VDDDTQKPKTHDVMVANSQVRVFIRGEACTNGMFVSRQPKQWAGTYENCPYIASGTTDANGHVFIGVPPTSKDPNTDYVVIAKTPPGWPDNDADDPDAAYSGKQVNNLKTCEVRKVNLRQIRTADGKNLPSHDTEDQGTYLAIVEPDYMNWTSTVAKYPFILVADGEWGVTTTVAPPEGFEADTNALSTTVVDQTSALQFTLTDVGSDWTQVNITQDITHKGKKIKHTSAIKLFNKKKPKNDAALERVPGLGSGPEAGLRNAPAPVGLFAAAPQADRRESGLAQILGLFASAAALLVLRLVP
jgi:hypothetical protein